MMKKYFLILGLLNFVFGTAQCTIAGAETIQVGEKQTYSVENAVADCNDCYEWSYMDQNVILESDTQKNPLMLKGALPGEALLELAVKSPEGILKCSKLIKVIAPVSNVLDINAQKCNITTDSFKEIRVSDNEVAFEPDTTEPGYSYKWTVTYRNESQKTATEKLGKFNFSNENVIDKVELQVIDRKCTKRMSKSYNNYFWYFF